MKPLILTERAIAALAGLSLDFEDLLSTDAPSIRSPNVHVGDHGVYVLTSSCSTSSRILVIRRWPGGLFEAIDQGERRAVLDRCIRVALRSFDKSKVSLNPRWMPFHAGNRVSIFASTVGTVGRIVTEVNVHDSGDVYVFEYASADEIQHIDGIDSNIDVYQCAKDEFSEHIEHHPADHASTEGQFELERLDPNSITRGLDYDEWFRRLSPRQKDFVEHKLVGPLKLRGGAGTGKTLAMVMKAVGIRREADAAGAAVRVLYLTHSWSLAEQIDGMIEQIDPRDGGSSTLDVYPLLEIATRRDYTKIGRQPLGLDSEEGKRRSLEVIREIVEQFRVSDWPAYRGNCTEPFIDGIAGPPEARARRNLVWDLLVEFGCVLAAQGNLGRESDLEKYLRIKRARFMMPLANATEREVVFRLWSGYLQRLKVLKLISTDQIITDLLNDLQTFYWEAARVDEGYDIVFVDEAHLFNAQERLTFHQLLSDGDKKPSVVMALDPRQSPRELFVDIVDDGDTKPRTIYDRARLPGTEQIDLVDVYRYTPQIEALIKSVLSAIPGLGLDEDWDLPLATSKLQDGAVASYQVVADKLESFKVALTLARGQVASVRNRSGRVAILCMDPDRFEAYLPAANRPSSKDLFVVQSRDDVARLAFMSRQIVFSTPEYVAGLQFDTVILIDANDDLTPDTAFSGHQKRRFLSELYLGLSRAEQNIMIIASRDGNGLSRFLKPAEQDNNLIKVG